MRSSEKREGLPGVRGLRDRMIAKQGPGATGPDAAEKGRNALWEKWRDDWVSSPDARGLAGEAEALARDLEAEIERVSVVLGIDLRPDSTLERAVEASLFALLNPSDPTDEEDARVLLPTLLRGRRRLLDSAARTKDAATVLKTTEAARGGAASVHRDESVVEPAMATAARGRRSRRGERSAPRGSGGAREFADLASIEDPYALFEFRTPTRDELARGTSASTVYYRRRREGSNWVVLSPDPAAREVLEKDMTEDVDARGLAAAMVAEKAAAEIPALSEVLDRARDAEEAGDRGLRRSRARLRTVMYVLVALSLGYAMIHPDDAATLTTAIVEGVRDKAEKWFRHLSSEVERDLEAVAEGRATYKQLGYRSRGMLSVMKRWTELHGDKDPALRLLEAGTVARFISETRSVMRHRLNYASDGILAFLIGPPATESRNGWGLVFSTTAVLWRAYKGTSVLGSISLVPVGLSLVGGVLSRAFSRLAALLRRWRDAWEASREGAMRDAAALAGDGEKPAPPPMRDRITSEAMRRMSDVSDSLSAALAWAEGLGNVMQAIANSYVAVGFIVAFLQAVTVLWDLENLGLWKVRFSW